MTIRKPYQEVIFVSKPRCASTAIFEHIYDWDDDTDGAKPMYHSTAFDMISRMGVPCWISVPSFAIVRNPQSLVESWFMHHKFGARPSQDVKSQYPDTIEEWIEKDFCTHWDSSWSSDGSLANPLPQKQWVDHTNKQLVTMVLKLEDLNWSELEEFGIDMSTLPIRNIAPSLSTPLSSQAIQKIEEYFAEDYERFGY